MKFQSPNNEIFFAAEVTPERDYMFDHDLKTGLSIIWNVGEPAHFMIDKEEFVIESNELVFLTEFHHIDRFRYSKLKVIQFNRPFHCIEGDDTGIGCKGVLFFGASGIPRIMLSEELLNYFEMLWDNILMEVDEMDHLQLEMLRLLLKRFLILSLRAYKRQHSMFRLPSKSIALVTEYNYLVERRFKEFTKVTDYANLLHKSSKTLTNTFKKYMHKSPRQIINERRLLEARRLLIYTDMSIQEIANELSFSDIQSFSHFFSSMIGLSPRSFRKREIQTNN